MALLVGKREGSGQSKESKEIINKKSNHPENTVTNHSSSIHSSIQGYSMILQSSITNTLTGQREARSKRLENKYL